MQCLLLRPIKFLILIFREYRIVKPDAIAFQCGYAASPAYLKTYFRRETGMTMREW